MKKIVLTIAAFITLNAVIGQTEKGINYQAMVRSSSGEVITNQDVSYQISILENSAKGNVVYTETHNLTSNAYGLTNFVIGKGTALAGEFSEIKWGDATYFVKIELDEKGGSNFKEMGTSQLQSVPYAMHATTAENVFSGDYNDLINKPEDDGQNKSAGIDWATTGNNTVANDFLGTTNAQDLKIKVDNQEKVRITQKGQIEVYNTGSSVFVGYEAGEHDDHSGNNNSFIGYKSGNKNTNGSYSTGVGAKSLYYNNGAYNSALGSGALFRNVNGNYNTAVGRNTLFSNNGGSYNTAIGASSNSTGYTGSYNTSVGVFSLNQNRGDKNTAIGKNALKYNTTGDENTAIGQNALLNNTTGDGNIALGARALFHVNSSRNIGIGELSLDACTSGAYNIALGYRAFSAETAYGYGYGGAYDRIGAHNIAIGAFSQSMSENNVKRDYNVSLGAYAMQNYRNNENSTAIGSSAMNDAYAKNGTALGCNSFIIAANINGDNSTAIGNATPITWSNQVHLGNSSITEVSGQVPYSPYSDGRIKDNITENVKGLDFILKLRPVTYNFNKDRQDKLMGITDSTTYEGKYDIEKIVFSGFIAQEVEEAAKSTKYDFSGVKTPKHENDLYKLGYSEFVVPLVKAMQEQQAMIEILQKRITELENK